MGVRLRLIAGCGILLLLSVLATAGGAGGFFLLARDLAQEARAHRTLEQTSRELLRALDEHFLTEVAWLVDPASQANLVPLQSELDRAFHEFATPASARGAGRLSAMREALDAYRLRSEQLLHSRLDQVASFFSEHVLPAYRKLRGPLVELDSEARSDGLRVPQNAADEARTMGSWLMALAILAVLSAVLFLRWLRSSVLARLVALERGATRVLQGACQRLDDRESDELGHMARALNTLQDRLEIDTHRDAGLLTHMRQVMLSLVETLPPGSSVHGLDGTCLASRSFGNNPEREAGVTAWLVQHGREHLEAYRSGQTPPVARFDLPRGDHMRVELLLSGDGRPVAWLAIVAGAPATLPDTTPEPSSLVPR
ncbi:MAG: methyl-accepting chemotaxis protein [Myxococcales bacterium]|nr:methyl-accepting chemotaxis protein [Myxococcales bacterium]